MTLTNRLLLIIIDGCRPDGLAAASTPNIDAIIRRGAYTPAAQAVMPSMTLPCHQSIFNGVPPDRHGIITNTFTPFVRPIKGLVQTIRAAGGKCAAFYGWEEQRDLSPPGHLEASVFLNLPADDKTAGDSALADLAATWLAKNAWNFAFIHLDATDALGHRHGWMSPEYLKAIENADRCIGQILAAVGETSVIVTADHGGHGKTHGTSMPEDMTIPFAIAGPGIPAGSQVKLPFDLTGYAATICAQLDIAADADWTGAAVQFE